MSGYDQPRAEQDARAAAGHSSALWRKVRPGLYARIDTPKRVTISPAFADAVRAEGTSVLDAILAAAIAEDGDAGPGET